MMGVGKLDPEATLKAGLAEIKARPSAWGKEHHVLVSEDEDTGDELISILGIGSCHRRCNNGVKVKNYKGKVWAAACKCSERLSAQERAAIDNAAAEICKSGIPPLFANRSYGGQSFDEVAPQELKQWLGDICSGSPPEHSCIVLCGAVGNGKTHLASDCIKHYIRATGWQARYLTASELVETKKHAIVYGDRQHRDDRSQVDYFKRVMNYGGLVVVDEIRASLTKTEGGYLEGFIDKRYQSGLPTVFISNHTFNKKTSYEGVTIRQILGERIADRMRASLYHEFNGPSRRGVRSPDSYTKEEMNSFCLPKSVLAQRDGELQILNWMTRNPIFETIRRDHREVAVDKDGKPMLTDGVPVDVSRKSPKEYKDVWQKGDQLILWGPVLDASDAKTYLVCLDLLKQQHSDGRLGLSLIVNSHDLVSALSKRTNSSDNWEATHRSLTRITLATISYVDDLGRQWTGPLLDFSYNPNVAAGRYKINFNQSMIEFYKTYEYARIHRKLFDAKIGTDGVRMQMFLRSHDSNHFDRMDFDGWMRFLSKPVDKMDASPEGKKMRRKHQQIFSRTVRKQVQAGLLTVDSALKRGKKISLTVTPM